MTNQIYFGFLSKQIKMILAFIVLISVTSAALAGSSRNNAKSISYDISNATIASIENAIKTRQTSCEGIIKSYLMRIEKYNLDTSRGAAINAFTSLNPSVMSEAKQLDKSFRETGKLVGPLHCVPIVVKDNIDTYDSTSTSGSLAMLGSQPNKDAFLVSKMREAGGIIIGKGTMDEFASGMSGISSRSGRTGNAYDPVENPGGSSAGPAAAVSANFAVVGIGTDNSGSVRVPAAFNGIYGLRPSTGLISQSGIFPRGNLDGVAGPLTRSIEDMATVLAVIAKPDMNDKQTLKHSLIKSYSKLLDKKNLKGLRFGIIRSGANFYPFKHAPKEIQDLFATFFSNLKTEGASLIDIDLPDFNANRKDNMAGEIQQINQYLSSFPSTRKDFIDICTSGRTKIFGDEKECLDHIKETADINSSAYKNAELMFKSNREYVTNLMKKYNLDALLIPITSQGKATYDATTVNTWQLPISSNSGLPSIVVNAGYTHGKSPMPVGMEIIGKFYDEAELLQIAKVIENETPPKIQPAIDKAISKKNSDSFSIAKYNNLLTKIGYNSYVGFLQQNKPEKLTPSIFNKILTKSLEENHGVN